MKSCLDCLYCKLINRRRELRCKVGMWQKNDLTEKFLHLTKTETITLDINMRNIFHLADQCLSFHLMD